jgi:hypothetical protein
VSKSYFSGKKNANIWPKQKLIGTGGILKHINTQKRTQKKTLDHNFFSWPADTSGLKMVFRIVLGVAILKPKTYNWLK